MHPTKFFKFSKFSCHRTKQWSRLNTKQMSQMNSLWACLRFHKNQKICVEFELLRLIHPNAYITKHYYSKSVHELSAIQLISELKTIVCAFASVHIETMPRPSFHPLFSHRFVIICFVKIWRKKKPFKSFAVFSCFEWQQKTNRSSTTCY